MALLRLPLGCLSSAILRLLLAVAVLAAAYFLLVKPALNNANDAVHRGEHRLTRCFKHSHGDVTRIARCPGKL